MSACDCKGPIIGSHMFRDVVAKQGLGLGGFSVLLSAPLLQCTKSFWEARMVLPASPRGRSPAAVQRVQMFRSDSGYV